MKNNFIKVYFFPSASKNGYSNPYCNNFKKILKENFQLLDESNKNSVAAFNLLKMSFKADIFFLNWIESIYFHKLGIIQFYIAFLSLYIIKKRKKKIIWVFHNIHPHQGNNYFTEKIQKWLYKNSECIITHSKEAAAYAQKHTKRLVYYKCHPIKSFPYKLIDDPIVPCDILIWGAIMPYKGIVEFLTFLKENNSTLRVTILGKCKDKELENKILSLCNKYISFQNKKADFDEIASYITRCRLVLFPYVGDCVSSSGALIDTIVMNGNVCGPKKGAFIDLYNEGVAFVYESYNEIISIINSNKNIDEIKRRNFIKQNSWENFSTFICDIIHN